MSTAQATQDSRSAQDAGKRRKRRKERSAKNQTPEPREIVSGAGQPLDVGVRRELEEQLGHDFGQVRLHADRDADALTDMLGADAVAVGQDIFFREGAYRPGTADGQRLLAHELLHTVQNPHGLGALRAGRDLGAVSVPQQPIEREAESAAQESVPDTPAATSTPAGSAVELATNEPAAAEVEPGQATPGWLRYATVDADRHRMEQLNPATLVDRLVSGVLRSLRGDPADMSHRVQTQLARMAPDLQDAVLDRLEVRLTTPEHTQLLKLIDEAAYHPPKLGPALTPEPVPDTSDHLQDVRTDERKSTARDKRFDAARAEDAQAEQEADNADGGGSGTQRGDSEQPGSQEAQDEAVEQQALRQRRAKEHERAQEQQAAQQEELRAEKQRAQERRETDRADREKTERQQADAEQAQQERAAQRESDQRGRSADERRRREQAEKSAGGERRQEASDARKSDQPGPFRPEKVDEWAQHRDSSLSEHGLHAQDEDEGDPREEELPLGLEAGADTVIGSEEADRDDDTAGAGEVALKPEDYLPDTDLDLSSVPTAENPDAPMPTFPKPPPTKAEKVHERRENEPVEEEDEDEPAAETKAPGAEVGPVEGEAPQPEGGPAAEAGDRTDKDLQPEKPVEQEVGPDPETSGEKDPEPEAEKADPEQEQAQEAAKTAADRRGSEGQDTDADGGIPPDAREADKQQQERKEQEERARQQDSKGEPQGAAAEKPASSPSYASSSAGTADGVTTPPAGAHTEQTKVEDRRPSPAVRRVADSAKGESEAADPQSQIPKQNGAGAAPNGTVGGTEPEGPSVSAGPGGAPPVAQAAVSPAGEETQAPGKMGAPGSEGAKAKPDASLEKDGGGCAPPAPPQEKDEPKPSCGGGGGGQKKQEKEGEPPDVSGQDPKAALNTVSSLPPEQAHAALPGLDASAEQKARENRQELAANPPKRQRPAGAPRTRSAPPESAPPEPEVKGKLERVEPEKEGEKQKAEGGEKARGEMPTADVPPPQINPGKDGKIDASDAGSIEAAAARVPTTDPALRNKTVGPAPKIRLEGKSDPKRTDKQAKKLDEKQQDIHQTGRADAAKPLGEDQIYPNVPNEQLRGEARGSGSKQQGGAQQSAGPAPKPGVGDVAEQERGGDIKAASAQASSKMVSAQKEHQQAERQTKQEKQAEIDEEVQRNAEKQTAERQGVAEQANAERRKWRDAQDKEMADADKKAKKEHDKQNEKITKARDDKDKEINDRQEADNKEIDDEVAKAEEKAEKEKEEAKEESDSLFGKIVDAIGDFFSALLDAVTAIFDAARKAVNGIIDKFKEFANKAIDFVRDLAVAAINAVADVLIAVCDVLLAAFPKLREKFRNAIESMRDAAIDAVNKLADALKKVVNKLLDALAAGLNALLDALEAGIKGAIKIYRDAIIGALKFAKAAIEALGKFAELVADIAPDPGGWLSRLGSSAKTGITDHLWGAIKTSVKEWFENKVEGILGLGKAVINVLVKGCVSLKQIGKMAWEAIVASLPMMIASIVIEKVISMLVPAAGAILTIVQGLMAAWQSLSEILTAFSKFWDYLKAVKAGPAACLFAQAVAAGIVALLEFISNFLLIRLEMATKGVGKRLKAMAQKIMKGLKKTGKGAKKAAGSAVNKARGAARSAQEALKKPDKPAKPTGPRVPERRAESADRSTTRSTETTSPKDAMHDRPTSKVPDKERQARKDHGTDDPKTEADREQQKQDTASTGGSGTGRSDTDTTSDTTSQSKSDKTPDKKSDTDKDKPADQKSDSQPEKTPDSDRDDAADHPKKKKRETEAPKRTKPREPTSPLGKHLKRVKARVKAALKKIRNTRKTLGKKLRKSKLGKSLKDSGKKIRDFFNKKRDNLRDDKKRRANHKNDQQKERSSKERNRESKSKRLHKIAARIRPKLRGILTKGVFRTVMVATLGGMRIWYRLTELALRGSDSVDVVARLNPTEEVGEADQLEGQEAAWAMEEPQPPQPPQTAQLHQQRIQRHREQAESQQAPGSVLPQGTARPDFAPKINDILDYHSPKYGKFVEIGETNPFSVTKSRQARDKRTREKTGIEKTEQWTADHIPSGRAIIQVEQDKAIAEAAASDEELKRLLDDENDGILTQQEQQDLEDRKKEILNKKLLLARNKKEGRGKHQEKAEDEYKRALTLLIPERIHKKGRTWGGKNQAKQYERDAKDLTRAAKFDFQRYLSILSRPPEELTKEYVVHFTRHYKNLVDNGIVRHSRGIDRMLIYYWEKAK